MKLIYFTSSYPFGLGEQWKQNELKVLANYFSKITVVPFSYAGNFDHPKSLPEGVELTNPLFKDANFIVSKWNLFNILFNKNIVLFIREFIEKKVYQNKGKISTWYVSTLNAIRLLEHPSIKTIIDNADQDTLLYFYWGRGSCEFLPFVDTSIFRKVVVKMHRYDLFEHDLNNYYIPYRKFLLRNITLAAPSSQTGEGHLKELYPQYKSKIRAFRCGTIGNGKLSKMSDDETLRVVSCSYMVPVKRIQIIIKCLSHINIPIQWFHIGEGPLRSELEKLVEELNVGSKITFLGEIKSEDILNYYTDKQLDLFVNVSESEGVPFSIMEAFSVGIPVFATNVGGTGEIVDDSVGKILEPDITGENLAKHIEEFYLKAPSEKAQMRMAAHNRYQEKCDAIKLTEVLAEYLLK